MADAITLIVGLLSIISIIVILHYTGGLSVLSEAMTWVRSIIDWMAKHKVMSIILFLFLLAVADGVFTFFISMNYVCDSSEALYTTKYGVIGGMGFWFNSLDKEINTTGEEYNVIVSKWADKQVTYDTYSERNIISVRCFGTTPKLTLFGLVDILNFQYWILILLIGGLVGFIFKGDK